MLFAFHNSMQILEVAVAQNSSSSPNQQSMTFWDIIAALAPWAAFLTAVVVAGIAWKTLQHQRANDARTEWWRRTQWAMESTASKDAKLQRLGGEVLKSLALSNLTSREDKQLLDSVWQESSTQMNDQRIAQLLSDSAQGSNSTNKASAGGVEQPEDRPYDPANRTEVLDTLRREIQAAQLKVVLDQELGRSTSDAVKKLAAMQLPRDESSGRD